MAKGRAVSGASAYVFPCLRLLAACAAQGRSAAADAPAADRRGLDPDIYVPLTADPGLDARPHRRGPFLLVLHVVRGPLDQDGPAGAVGRVHLVDLERDLVFRLGDPGAEILVDRIAFLGAEDDRPVEHLEVHRHDHRAVPAGEPDPSDLRLRDEPQRLGFRQLFYDRLHTTRCITRPRCHRALDGRRARRPGLPCLEREQSRGEGVQPCLEQQYPGIRYPVSRSDLPRHIAHHLSAVQPSIARERRGRPGRPGLDGRKSPAAARMRDVGPPHLVTVIPARPFPAGGRVAVDVLLTAPGDGKTRRPTMDSSIMPGRGPLAIDLNSPGSYVHWSIFTISVANLVLIAVMVAIFGAALLLPFPGRRHGVAPAAPGTDAADPGTANPGAATATATGQAGTAGVETGLPGADAGDADRRMWTIRVRRRALALLPPQKLLPDRQPAYVASWVYVFGVASLAALFMAIVSGFAIALGGTDWWHTNPVGHFFNSVHLWSVELFMAFMVIHLWGKFWMAAWRGRRAMTWITGVVAFLASVVEAFTGYLTQQNFDSQWIATNGKDAFNAAGAGAFFNLLDTGQMLLWHVVLIPLALVAIVGAHVLLVRIRGVSPPLPASRPRGIRARRAARAADAAPWRGPTRRYDILKEGAVASVIALALTLGLAGLLSSPDTPPVTVQSWAKAAPADFLGTAASELADTSTSAGYGPPYNTGTGSVQKLVISPQTWFGVTQPVDSARTFVLSPLSALAPTSPALAASLSAYQAAPAAQQHAWATAYGNA